ncbi:MAG: RNA polymerase sigma factor [Chitinophagaceae bacterium]|nr:RNA polymerase sigma factor [Chitinophagaceae bacterium]
MRAAQNFSDEELIMLVRNGKTIDEPVKYIYEQHFYSLSSYIEQNQGTREDAEDIFQEVILTFISLIQQNKFRGESSVKTFLFSINRNTWLNELKKRGRKLKREEKFSSSMSVAEPEIEKYISNRESRKLIFDTIENLGELCRKILLAFYYENLSITEILTHLDYQNEQVVRNKKAKCMKSLEEKFNANPALAQKFKNALQYE